MHPIVLVFALAATAPIFVSAETLPYVETGFTIQRIATVEGARELAATPNGDLIVGTTGSEVYIVAHAEASAATPQVFTHMDDAPAAGVALSDNSLYIGTQFGVYKIPYSSGDLHARGTPVKVAAVRISRSPGAHSTTSVAVVGSTLFASVGSSCDACKPEIDATRATIQKIDLRTGQKSTFAEHIRNAIALAINPVTSSLWAGVAGADELPPGHPYEIFDDVTAHTPPVDYGWPTCFDNRKVAPQWPGFCADVAVPRIVFPAYDTPVGAAFYPAQARGKYAFPPQYAGGAFVTLHGSWHGPGNGLPGYVPPRVAFVRMHGDIPVRAVNWNDPDVQWSEFVAGYQRDGSDRRIGRPTGIAVGPEGSLFVADDLSGAIYRIRPNKFAFLSARRAGDNRNDFSALRPINRFDRTDEKHPSPCATERNDRRCNERKDEVSSSVYKNSG